MKKEYRRIIELIVQANENIVDKKDDDDDALWDEVQKLRKLLSYKENQVVQRLLHSIGYVEPKEVEIDEADPCSPPNWCGPS